MATTPEPCDHKVSPLPGHPRLLLEWVPAGLSQGWWRCCSEALPPSEMTTSVWRVMVGQLGIGKDDAGLCSATQSCLTLCNPMGYNPPGSSVHGIFQARILEWVAIPFSRGSSRPGDRTHFSCISCIGKQILYHYRHLGRPKMMLTPTCYLSARQD